MAPIVVNEDRLLGERVRLRQPEEGYRAAIDPVFLAAACPAGRDARVLDLGCGVGTAFLCLAARLGGSLSITGIESDQTLARIASENIEINNLSHVAEVVCQDIRSPFPPVSGRAGPHFTHIIMNPPFHSGAAADRSPDGRRARAMVDGDGDTAGTGEATLADWVAACRRLLPRRGIVTVIHRGDRLNTLLCELGKGFGGVRVIPLWPRPGRAAKRVLVTAIRDSRSPMTLTPGLVLHGNDGRFTADAEAILRGGRGVDDVVGEVG